MKANVSVDIDDKEFGEFLDFVAARERLCAKLVQVERIKRLELEMLQETNKTAQTLQRIQMRHPTWKTGDNVKELAAKAGLKKLYARTSFGEWLR
jgi:hypothetical protein